MAVLTVVELLEAEGLRAIVMFDVNDDAKGEYRRVEVLTGPGRRRRWSAEEKARIVEETLAPGARVSEGEHANLWGLFHLGYVLGSRDEGKLVRKMVWRVKLVAELEPGSKTEVEVACLERDRQAGLADLGLRLAEANSSLPPSRPKCFLHR